MRLIWWTLQNYKYNVKINLSKNSLVAKTVKKTSQLIIRTQTT